MEKELFMEEKSTRAISIQHDDLKFDGKHIIIPSYWAETLLDIVNNTKIENFDQDDLQDYTNLKNFIADINNK